MRTFKILPLAVLKYSIQRILANSTHPVMQYNNRTLSSYLTIGLYLLTELSHPPQNGIMLTLKLLSASYCYGSGVQIQCHPWRNIISRADSQHVPHFEHMGTHSSNASGSLICVEKKYKITENLAVNLDEERRKMIWYFLELFCSDNTSHMFSGHSVSFPVGWFIK